MNEGIGFSALRARLLARCVFAARPRTDQLDDRPVNQAARLEQGLEQGQLSTREAGQIERQESRIDQTEARDLKDGKLSPAEQAHINQMQNRTSRDIYRDRHNAVEGNPDSKSSQRMQNDV